MCEKLIDAKCLSLIMQGVFNEVFVIARDNLSILDANRSAQINLQQSHDELQSCVLTDISPQLTAHFFESKSRNIDHLFQTSEAIFYRKDQSQYLAEIRFFECDNESRPAWVVIARDISTQKKAAEELIVSRSRFSALVSNTPSLVYQFIRHENGSTQFTYLSEGCRALLGISPEDLCAEPERFTALIEEEDRFNYNTSMEISAKNQNNWNWEGRIWIDEWKDIKWINLRATPKLLQDSSVQWDGIMTNITKSKLEEIEIKHSRRRLAELSAHIENVKEQEQMRIAREIHDDLGGNLTAIKMALTLLKNRLPIDQIDLNEKADYVDQLVDRTIESTHRIARDLRPSILDLGIMEAIEWQAEEFQKQIGVECKFTSTCTDALFFPEQETAIFRIFQEALTNIAKHADATHVSIHLSETDSEISLKITDNGKGIEPVKRLNTQSFGIRGMSERANNLGGKLIVDSPNSGGCTVSLVIPKN